MLVLALNCGSSSVKFQLVAVDPTAGAARRLARGKVERIGGAGASFTAEAQGRPATREHVAAGGHDVAVRRIVDWVRSHGFAIEAAGHRVVHGGERFTAPARIDEAVLREIEALEDLAPLHNAPSLAGIRAARAILGPAVPMAAVFDTAFHATMPPRAARYAIPYALAERHGIRRFGFHGTSYLYVFDRYCRLTGKPAEQASIVAFHLGNGASAAAIRSGRSIDTSMGFTPLEGLVMGTRSGDVDPALVGFLCRKERITAEDVLRILNERSGLAGLSGMGHDMRDLLKRERDDPRARLAVDLFCYRARKYLGAYLAALGGADAVVFTGGIGEHSPLVRNRICEGMEWCGLRLDAARNERTCGRDQIEDEISEAGSRIAAWVISTDEELVIARDTAAVLEEKGGSDDGS
jgi:acetate kinase